MDERTRRSRCGARWFAACLLAAAALPAAVAGAQPASRTQPSPDRDETYRIGPHDVLDVSVWNSEELSKTVPVRPDGKISLPLVADVDAAGLTPIELAQSLTEKLGPYLKNPQVAVIVREVNSVSYSVIGQVNEAGRFPLQGRVTVFEAIAQAGGLTDFASPRKIVILRPNGNGMKRIAFDYARGMRPKPLARGIETLEPGDVVVVP